MIDRSGWQTDNGDSEWNSADGQIGAGHFGGGSYFPFFLAFCFAFYWTQISFIHSFFPSFIPPPPTSSSIFAWHHMPLEQPGTKPDTNVPLAVPLFHRRAWPSTKAGSGRPVRRACETGPASALANPLPPKKAATKPLNQGVPLGRFAPVHLGPPPSPPHVQVAQHRSASPELQTTEADHHTNVSTLHQKPPKANRLRLHCGMRGLLPKQT